MVWLIDWIGLLVTRFYMKAPGVYIGNSAIVGTNSILWNPEKPNYSKFVDKP